MFRVIGVMGICAAALAAFYPVSAYADVLELRNGQKLEGQYAGGSKGEVRFEVGSQTLKFPIAEISMISLGAADQKAFERAAKEVLLQLKALDSVVDGGVTYRDYVKRVSDTKIKVDQFLEEQKPSPIPEFNNNIADALQYYVTASHMWEAKVAPRWDNLFFGVNNPTVAKCASKGLAPFNNASLIEVSHLWQCARKSLTDAKNVLSH